MLSLCVCLCVCVFKVRQEGVTGKEGPRHGDMSAVYSKLLQPLFFDIELAEQDNLADMTAIVSVSVLVSLLSMLGEAQFTKRYIPPRDNILEILWSLVLMLAARFGSSRVVRLVMNFKVSFLFAAPRNKKRACHTLHHPFSRPML